MIMSRPTKLTPERAEKIYAMIRQGCTRDVAARFVGIDDSTLYRWASRGEKPNAPRIYREFFEGLKKADAEAEARAIEAIMQAAETDWRAAAWWLERTRPHKYGRRTEVTHEPSQELERLIDAMMQAAKNTLQ
jgi:transposase